ncbi:MAG: ABC transporter permease, partial [Ilumatobacteraceae bacterium]
MDRHHRLNQPPRWFISATTIPPSVIALGFVVVPVAMLIVHAISIDAIGSTFADSRTWEVLGFTTLQATLSTLATVTLGIIPGLIIARSDFRGRQLVLSMFAAVFVMPTVVMAAGVRALLPGDPDGLLPIVLAHTLFNLAIIVRGIAAAPLPTELERAATVLGARPTELFRTITLPLLRPTLLGLSAVVFALCFTSFGIIRILGSSTATTIEVEIWRETIIVGRVDRGVVLALIQLVTLALALFLRFDLALTCTTAS